MLKRLFDLILSFVGLIFFLPVFLGVTLLIWLGDFGNPLYLPFRVGKGEKLFRMVKLRSMVLNADKSGVDSTASNDRRITAVGKWIRAFKLDELSQLWNVFLGSMSFVGPRPNVKRETDLYTSEEKKLLTVRPGITDFASIVFADEGEILSAYQDPDLAYNQVIRPWKSRMALICVQNQSLWLDIKIIFYTALAIVDRNKALEAVHRELVSLKADPKICEVSLRKSALTPFPPPGATEIVKTRQVPSLPSNPTI